MAMMKQAGAEFMPYGPTETAVEVVQTFGSYEAEYAMIRKGVGVVHVPQRGVVGVRGGERLEFLHRMVTNDTRTLTPGQGRRAFLLNKAGRIIADMIVLHEADRTLIDLDVFQAASLPAELEKYLFTEDVTLEDQSSSWAHIALHGPASAKLLDTLGATGCDALEALAHRQVTLGGVVCVMYRHDETGAPGFHLLLPATEAATVYRVLTDAVGGIAPDVSQAEANNPTSPKRPIPGRGIGWLAYNTARIEAGTPLYHIDFGADCLPHETGILDQAVSFKKGCYLGQEIVARMQNLGHPKRIVVGVRCQDARLPVAGTQVFNDDGADVIGAITSSTVSPMLGGNAIAFAMVKWGKHREGVRLKVGAEGAMVEAVVQKLRFLP